MQRPDGNDMIFGDSGAAAGRNDAGDTTAQGHANDADAIVGDNGNIYRLVGVNGAGGYASRPSRFYAYNYDTYTNGGAMQIDHRARRHAARLHAGRAGLREPGRSRGEGRHRRGRRDPR